MKLFANISRINAISILLVILILGLGSLHTTLAQSSEIKQFKKQIENSTNSDEKIKLSLKIALEYYNQGDIGKALEYSSNAEQLLMNYTDDELRGSVHLYVGNFLLELSRFAEALNHFQASYKAYAKVNNIKKMTTVMSSIGVVFERLNNPELALEYGRRVIKNRIATNDSLGLATAYTNIGNIYEELEKYDIAFKYYSDAAYIDSVYGDIRNLSVDYNNLGFLFEKLKEYNTAMHYYQKSLTIDKRQEDKYNQSIVLRNISRIYLYNNELELAKSTGLESLNLAKKSGSLSALSKSYELLSHIETELENSLASLRYYRLYMDIEDSISKNIARMENESSQTIPHYDLTGENSATEESEQTPLSDKTFYGIAFTLLAIVIILLIRLFKQ